MPRNRDTEFWESSAMNNGTYIQYYHRLMELAMSMFDWQNVPDEIDIRYLELILFSEGKALFFKDDDAGGYATLRVAMNGPFNLYGIPINRRAYSINGYNESFTDENSVIIYNNLLHTNSKLDVEMFAKRLYNLDRTIDVNANAQKTPILVQANESQRLTMKNLYKQYEGNEPFIFGTKSLDVDGLKVLKTDAPYVADKLYALKSQYWNEALTYLGISNTNITKKERQISDEVMRNMGGIIASRYSRLQSRRIACDQINKMFGLDMWVDFREDYRESDDEYVLMTESETGEDKSIGLVADTTTNIRKMLKETEDEQEENSSKEDKDSKSKKKKKEEENE